jgi:two-component system, response regulator YesN
MSQKLILKKIEKHNNHYMHPSYYLEKRLLNEMKRELRDSAHETLRSVNKLERARLADTPIRSIKNSLIASATLFTRAAIEANVTPEDAFSLCDFCILEIERITNIRLLQDYEYQMLDDYINLIHENKIQSYNKMTIRIIEFIHENITETIALEDLVRIVNMSKEYICSMFKKNVGLGIIEYINYNKIEESKYFLKYSSMSISDIAFLFNFGSPGYFSSVFKKQTGLTPRQFKQAKL